MIKHIVLPFAYSDRSEIRSDSESKFIGSRHHVVGMIMKSRALYKEILEDTTGNETGHLHINHDLTFHATHQDELINELILQERVGKYVISLSYNHHAASLIFDHDEKIIIYFDPKYIPNEQYSAILKRFNDFIKEGYELIDVSAFQGIDSACMTWTVLATTILFLNPSRDYKRVIESALEIGNYRLLDMYTHYIRSHYDFVMTESIYVSTMKTLKHFKTRIRGLLYDYNKLRRRMRPIQGLICDSRKILRGCIDQIDVHMRMRPEDLSNHMDIVNAFEILCIDMDSLLIDLDDYVDVNMEYDTIYLSLSGQMSKELYNKIVWW